jgi:nitroreductase
MDFWEVIRLRHSVRDYDDRDVAQDIIERVLDAAIQAPSAGNLQSWHFIIVRNEGFRTALAQAAFGQKFVACAPVVIAVCAKLDRSGSRYGDRGRHLFTIQDTAAAIENILLAATALGLGTCWVGAFDEAAAAQALALPNDLRPVALIPIGYPRQPSSRSTSRYPVSEVSEIRD